MVDDFRLIKGIGPILAARLHKAGVHTYEDLASFSPTKLAAHLTPISANRIGRQDWIGQAGKLASKKGRGKASKNEAATPAIHQHYQNFTLEFLLDDNNVTRRTRVRHIQSGDADTWAGWEDEQLINFIARHATVQTPATKRVAPATTVAPEEALPNSNEDATPDPFRLSGPISPLDTHNDPVLPVTPRIKSASGEREVAGLAGKLRLVDLKVLPTDSDISTFALRKGRRYRFRITVDLREIDAPRDTRLTCTATIVIKLIGGPRRAVAETARTFSLLDIATLEVTGASLPAGVYRLDVFVRLTSDMGSASLTAFRKGDLLQFH